MTDAPALRLHNTLTRKKDDFVPLDPANVRMYVCGPTVYDYAHIGNARPVIVFDVLFRLLRHLYGPDHVTYARNITDVDDKINARAARDYPGMDLNDAIRNVTQKTTAQFHADVAALGCLPPTHEPRATDHIGKMVDIVGRLLRNGCAYIAQGSEGREVLFEIARMKAYGVLSRRKLDEQIEGARVAVEAHKRNPGDFVLWKESGAGEPGWQAVFPTDQGPVTIFGRPGWHIECSAMSMAKLLEPYGGGLACDDPSKNIFDIHGGGLDLIFPHHENEIAQSCCAFGTDRMASVWMHNGFLQVEGQKMSKSLGNFVTINEERDRWAGATLRLNMLKTAYRQPIDWTNKSLAETQRELVVWGNFLSENLGKFDPHVTSDILHALMDDLNTHEAITHLRRYFAIARSYKSDAEDARKALGALAGGLELLGVDAISVIEWLKDRSPLSSEQRKFVEQIIESEVQEIGLENFPPEIEAQRVIKILVAARLRARREKRWVDADNIRQILDAIGIAVKDGKDEAGNPISTWEVKR